MKLAIWPLLLLLLTLVFAESSCNMEQVKEHKILKSVPISEMEFSEKIVDLGTLSNDTNVQALFYIYNRGIKDIIIKNIETECSCTEYKINKSEIAPGDSVKLIVNLDTRGKTEGFQRSAVIIESKTKKSFNTVFIAYEIKEF